MSADSQRDYRASQIAAEAERRLRDMGRSGFHEGSESNYERLFGTPERAARMMALMCECSPECSFCLLKGRAVSICNNGDRDALLEWLRGDAE